MNIKVKGKLKYKDDGYSKRLLLYVKFKIPNKLLKVRTKSVLCSDAWINNVLFLQEYKNLNEFHQDVLSWLENEERLKKRVEEIIINYLNNRNVKNGHKTNEDKIKSLAKNKKFTLDIIIKK